MWQGVTCLQGEMGIQLQGGLGLHSGPCEALF